MKKYLYEILMKRSRRLYNDSLRAYNDKFYDLALVYLEQSLQLFLKAKILENIGEFPKTHDIKKLLEILNYSFSEEDLLVIDLLNDVYISGRYLEKEYSKEEYEKALNFVNKIFEKYGFRN
ncbi:DNA-binding protein [Nanoarchaeota archaeon]